MRLLAGIALMAGLFLAPTAPAGAAPGAHASTSSTVTVVASGLDSPRHLSVGPDGAIYVAEGGHIISGCTIATTGTPSCLSTNGAIGRLAGGSFTTVTSGLPSVATPANPPTIPFDSASGPSSVAYVNGQFVITMQDDSVTSSGGNPYGSRGVNLGRLVTAKPGSSTLTSIADLAKFAAQNPQTSASDPNPLVSGPLYDSNPYAVVPYQGGYAVADAAANSVLLVSTSGTIQMLARLPAATGGGDAVPTSLAVGPDGALYVGQLVGVPTAGSSVPGTANVYRIVKGQAPTVYASGFTAITDIAFDTAGRLLVLELNTKGLAAPPSGGALIRWQAGVQTVLASKTDGLSFCTGLAVAPDGSIYISNNGTSFASGTPSGQILRVAVPASGYRLAASDGGVFDFGQYRFYGSTGGQNITAPVVASAGVPDGPGYWLAQADGTVHAFGTAGLYSPVPQPVPLNKPIVGIAPTPDGRGYWLVASDGGVFSYGDAKFHGSAGGLPLNQPVVGVAATPDGGGYWLVARDGGVFSYGDAKFAGSTGGLTLNQPVIGMAAKTDGSGYWLIASDGGVFAFGTPFLGSMGGTPLNKPIVGAAASPDGSGYWLVASDGGIFSFGATFFGSTGSLTLSQPIGSMST
jgi:hypothetical protein